MKRISFQQRDIISTNQPFRRKSCHCSECGQMPKKMQFVNSTIQNFQTYHQLVNNHYKEQKRIMQQKQLRMRNKRHLLLKNAVNLIIKKDHGKKEIDPVEKVTQESKKPGLQKQLSQSPRKLRKRGTMISGPSPLKRGSVQTNLMPLDPYLIGLLDAVIDKRVITKKVKGTQDDFDVLQKVVKFDIDIKPIEKKPKFLEPLIQDEEEDDVQMTNHHISSQQIILPQIKVQSKRNGDYKEILKYHKRSLKNFIDKQQLSQTRTVSHLLKIKTDVQNSLTSPINQSTPMHISDSLRKVPLQKLTPIKNQIMRKSDVVFVMKSYTGIKHKKNYTFGSLSIKV